MSRLPEEVTGEVLRRLPVKPLLRFRCVSKSWRSLIDSKQFIRLHLHHSLRSNSNRAILVDSSKLYYIDLDSFKRVEIDVASIEPYSVVASCDGLVLLAPKPGNISLWNPLTRKMSKLAEQPPLPDHFYLYEYVQAIFAFGYDSKHDDYKVVRVVQAADDKDNGRFSSKAAIYSLKSDSWKKAADFPYLLPRHTSRWGVYLNGALHTVVKNGSKTEVIMAFDLGKEEHYELPMPPYGGGGRDGGFAYVEVIGGFLAAVVPGKKKSSEIWLMKEYGVKKSWMKLLRFDPPISGRCGDLRPLAFSRSGEEVLLSYDGICLNWYNLRKKSVTIACVSGLSASFNTTANEPVFDAEFCIGSLVSPFTPSKVDDEKRKDSQVKKGKKQINKKRSLAYYPMTIPFLCLLITLTAFVCFGVIVPYQ